MSIPPEATFDGSTATWEARDVPKVFTLFVGLCWFVLVLVLADSVRKNKLKQAEIN